MSGARPVERAALQWVVLAHPQDAHWTDAQLAAAARWTCDSVNTLLGHGARVWWCAQPAAAPAGTLHGPLFDTVEAAIHGLGLDGQADLGWMRLGTGLSLAKWHALQDLLDEWIEVASPLAVHATGFSPLPTRAGPVRFDRSALADWLWNHAPSAPLGIGGWLSDAGVLRASAVGALRTDQRRPGEAAVQRRVLLEGPACDQAPDPALVPTTHALTAAPALWADAHPLTGLRAAVGDVLPQLQAAVSPPVPAEAALPERRPVRRLHVSHSWGGGLAKWIRDFITADQQEGSGEGLVLRSVGIAGAYGQRLSLYAGTEEVHALRFWELGVPIHATATSHAQVREVLAEIVRDFQVDQVVVSSLIGHSLDVLRTGLPTVVVAHDHYPYCVALYAHFDGECRSCSPEKLQRCLASNPDHRFFGEVPAEAWLHLRRAFVDTVRARSLSIIAPVPSVAERWQSMMPELSASQFRVIGHGLDPAIAWRAVAPAESQRLRVVVLGRLTPEKGAHLLLQMREGLAAFADLILLGCGADAAAHWQGWPGVECVAHYQPAELPTRMAAARPDVGLLMSTVPETFSYALSELWALGLPVVATDQGALADRIQTGVNGFLEPVDASALVARLHSLHTDRELLARLRAQVQSQPVAGLAEMVRAYDTLLVRWPRSQAPEAPVATIPHPLEVATRPSYASVVQVNPQVTWAAAARAFWQYTCHKASRSPKLSGWLQRWFSRRR